MNNSDIRKLMVEAIKTPEGTEILKETIKEHFPPEYAETMIGIIDGQVKLSKEAVDENINNKILDGFNSGERSKKEMDLLFRGKLSKKEVEDLKKEK